MPDMQLRRFTADSTPAALGAVRLALGDDAIILANRRHGDMVEIIATGQMEDVSSLSDSALDQAVEESAQATTENHPLKTDTATGSVHRQDTDATDKLHTDTAPVSMIEDTPSSKASESLIAELTHDIDSISVAVPALQLQQPVSVAPDSVQISSAAQLASYAHSKNADKPCIESDQNDKATDSPAAESEPATLQTESLLAAIDAQSAQMDLRFRGLEVNLWGSCSPNRSVHLRRLFALGIGAELAVRLVERCDEEMPVDEALRQSFALLKSTLPIGNDKTLNVPGVTVVSGPPGAGKTTALIKLATQHVKQHGNQSIVIICADTRRIGAFEELQAYGRLLGVPTVHAHDASEMESLIDAFTHKQLVLLDYTLPEGEGVIELPDCLMKPEHNDRVRHLFVLPASLQSSTADALISRYCAGRSIQCVLTHLDTCARLGELFSALIRHHLPVAYWSDSPSVQLPLQRADASVLVATAVAMSRRIEASPDDEWLQRLIQPANQLMADSLLSAGAQGAQQL